MTTPERTPTAESASTTTNASSASARPTKASQLRAAKRTQVSVACEECRRRKTRCDGVRPCSNCRARSTDCYFLAGHGESRGQALRRKYDELELSHSRLNELFALIPQLNDREIWEFLQDVRGGHSVENSLQRLKRHHSTMRSNALTPSQPRDPQFALLRSVLQCTNSLDEVSDLVMALTTGRYSGQIFRPESFDPLRNRVVSTLSITRILERALQDAEISTPYGALGAQIAQGHGHALPPMMDDQLDIPNFLVPANPWTEVTGDDGLMSHLVSLFLNYVNIYWRFLELDIFVPAMQSRDLNSRFCSPFLVNAICGIACVYSEHEGAYADHDDFITRGEHFCREALRLWLVEDGRESITNLQALAILAMTKSLRGKDKLGMTLLTVAIQMNKTLPLEQTPSEVARVPDSARARVCLAWTVHYVDVTWSLGLMRTSTSIDHRLTLLPNLADTVFTWCARPFSHVVAHYWGNALFRERCMIHRLTAELNELLFSDKLSGSLLQFQMAAANLESRIRNWFDMLPTDLRYSRTLPAPMFELHAEYHCTLTTLCDVAAERLNGKPTAVMPTSTASRLDQSHAYAAAEWTAKGTSHALSTATLLRDYREEHGMKVSLPFIFQAEAVASFALLQRLGAAPDALHIQAAFGEAFRCLLGTATQIMIARGVARMLRRSAEMLGIPLPLSIMRVPAAVANVTWRSSDLARISSTYPNYATESTVKAGPPRGMEELLHQWEDLAIEEPPVLGPEIA